MQVNQDKPSIPLHAQLVTYFRERILDGTLPPDSQLPTEIEIARTHHISRNTVRQAMSTLVHEGLLNRVQGSGTFVRHISASRPKLQHVEKRIGVVLMYASDQLSMELLIGIDQAAKSRGYQVSFTCSMESSTQQLRDIERMQAERVSGLIVFPVSNETDNPAIARLQGGGLPVVLIDRYLPDCITDYVVADNFAGAYRATEHLLILGHTRIGFTYSHDRLATTSIRDRRDGYRAALRDHGVPYDERLVFGYPTAGEFSDDEPYIAFLSQPDRPSALHVSTDLEVPILFTAASRCGLRIPEDLAVVGFDDLSFAPYLSPPLTTVAQPRMEIGLRAAHLLINRIEGNPEPPKHIVVPTNLVVRDSCGARQHIRQSVLQGTTSLRDDASTHPAHVII
ncbi:MAG: GntR family transcriptional regulator [Herpetosiphonaceae bacterium]|nr:GntR family transcriptional regulator [Herpetosiphonaceae bacterium]